jgi:hypothetical protein
MTPNKASFSTICWQGQLSKRTTPAPVPESCAISRSQEGATLRLRLLFVDNGRLDSVTEFLEMAVKYFFLVRVTVCERGT